MVMDILTWYASGAVVLGWPTVRYAAVGGMTRSVLSVVVLGRWKKMSKKPPLTRPLSGEEALQVALLGTVQITIKALRDRLDKEPNRQFKMKREYWLERMEKAVEAIDLTLDGYVNPEFERKFVKYQKLIEGDITSLLMTYKEEL
jgi:hypothetical protein